MRKRITPFVFLLLTIYLLSGCSMRSNLKGRVVNAEGHPFSGAQVLAKPVTSGNKSAVIDTMTKKDGTFELRGLDPFSTYHISISYEGLRTDGQVEVEIGMADETHYLKKPISVTIAFNSKGSPLDLTTGELRFVKSADDIITDTKTGLQWIVGPDENTTWYQALTWISELYTGGNGWGMPSTEELKTLYIKGAGKRHLAPLFKTTGWWVWSGQEDSSSMAWNFTFRFDRSDMVYRNYSDGGRAFAVRDARR